MNLQNMQAQFTSLLNRRDLTANSALVTTLFNQGIMRVQRDLRCPANEIIANVVVPSGFTGLEIPEDYLELKEIRPQANNRKLIKKSLDQVLVASQTQGVPCVYQRQGSVWRVGPKPQAGDVITVSYWSEFPALVNPTDENNISIIAWDLFVYAALVQAAVFYVDKRKDEFENQYQMILTAINNQADEDELGDDASMDPGLYYPSDDTAFDAVITD